ncbi:asparagine synthase-related protein [Sphingomonas sp. MMS24-J45]|uniref:asparagine synthase-related protein n=1 Tax=Sphingomonas sp. MMS24-J45 TaxID=3238806 RepID=UPI00384F5C6F
MPGAPLRQPRCGCAGCVPHRARDTISDRKTMFALLLGARTADTASAMIAGCGDGFRVATEPTGYATAIIRAPDLLPEDRFDVQPIIDGGKIFVCKGRIDRRDELATRLAVERARAGAMADSALLHMAWCRWRGALPEAVSGDYAYAAFDPATGRLDAAVDHWGGAAALFWAATQSGLIVADNLALLLRHPEVDRELARAELAGFVQLGIDRETTPYRAVRAVPGGHRLCWRGREVTVERWWKPDTAPIFDRDPRLLIDEARDLLRQATAERMRSSGRTAAMLSGGLDSGIVAALAATARPDTTILAYTGVPEPGLEVADRPGWEADDGPAAALTAARYPNLAHRLVSVGNRSWPDLIARLGRESATPVRGSANLLWLDEISRCARADGARVLLTGQHGNFSFSHNGNGALAELAAYRQWRPALRLLGEVGDPVRQARILKRYLAEQWRHRRGAPFLLPGTQFLQPEARALIQPSFLFLDKPSSRARWLRFATTAPHYWRCDAAELWGLDWRDPTADRRFLEWMLRMPLAAFRFGGLDRGLARELGRDLLPEAIRLRTVRGAQGADAAAWIRRDREGFSKHLQTIATSETPRALLDHAALERGFTRILDRANKAGDVEAWLSALTLGAFLAQAGDARCN